MKVTEDESNTVYNNNIQTKVLKLEMSYMNRRTFFKWSQLIANNNNQFVLT